MRPRFGSVQLGNQVGKGLGETQRSTDCARRRSELRDPQLSMIIPPPFQPADLARGAAAPFLMPLIPYYDITVKQAYWSRRGAGRDG